MFLDEFKPRECSTWERRGTILFPFLFWGYFCLKRTQDVIRCPNLNSKDDFGSIILLPKFVAFQAAQLPMTSLVTAIFRCFSKRLLFSKDVSSYLCALPPPQGEFTYN